MVKKKTGKKAVAAHKAKTKKPFFISVSYIRYIGPVVVILLVIIAYTSYTAHSSATLGARTYLARGGDDGTSGSTSSGSDSSSPENIQRTTTSESHETSVEQHSGSLEPTRAFQGRPLPVFHKEETELNSDDRLEVEATSGAKIDLKSPGMKVLLETKDDRVQLTAQNSDGTTVDLKDSALSQVRNDLGQDDLDIENHQNSFVIKHASISATTKFPLSLDLATNELLVTTPHGTKAVTVLPDQAVQNLLSHNIMTRLTVINTASSSAAASSSNNEATSAAASLPTQMVLEEQNNQLVFRIDGVADKKLLGMIPVSIDKTALVSAETGDIVKIQESFINRLFDLLSL